ncbi:hypothetical protein DU505_20810 [Billgrantia montanilacus]|uniref:Uncharacterized protein n=1 Tax=Billgrantia montanilacus TaxID=2282305 RepID=A0A368TP75_9GAMM|nr:hypothetical protein DU505_20810 [Halomonas montanilacus]
MSSMASIVSIMPMLLAQGFLPVMFALPGQGIAICQLYQVLDFFFAEWVTFPVCHGDTVL